MGSQIRKNKRLKAARLAASQLSGVQHDLDTCRQELKRSRTSSKEVIVERDALRTENGKHRQQLKNSRGLISVHEMSITALQEKMIQLEDTLSVKTDELRTAQKRIASLEANDKDAKQLRSRLRTKQKTIDELQKCRSREIRAAANA